MSNEELDRQIATMKDMPENYSLHEHVQLAILTELKLLRAVVEAMNKDDWLQTDTLYLAKKALDSARAEAGNGGGG